MSDDALNPRIRQASEALVDTFCSELDHGQEQPRMRDELCQVLVDLMDVVEQTGMDGILTEAHDKLKAMEFVERRKR